jgi:hypothetical protein
LKTLFISLLFIASVSVSQSSHAEEASQEQELTKACESGTTKSCELAGDLANDRGGDMEAIRLYDLACAKKSESACAKSKHMKKIEADSNWSGSRDLQLKRKPKPALSQDDACFNVADVDSECDLLGLAADFDKGADAAKKVLACA